MKSIIESFSSHGTLIQPDTLEYIMSKEEPQKFTSFLTKNLKEYPFVLTLDHVKKIEDSNNVKSESKNSVMGALENTNVLEPICEVDQDALSVDVSRKIDFSTEDSSSEKAETVKSSWKPKAKEYDSEIKIFKDITGNSVCEGKTDDFARLFANRYEELRKIIRSQRREMANVIPINRVGKNGVKDFQIIGIVKEVRNTSNGHRFIELEDESGVAKCIVLKKDRGLLSTAKEVVLDEVIGIKGQLSKHGDLILVENIVFPDVSIQRKKNRAEIPLYAAFLSDIHIGSKKFMEKQWNCFIRWINGEIGNSRQRDVAGKIKYLVIPGDVVDGIGIYPNQEEELSIKDVYQQYEALAEELKRIPDHISIIMQPGNHDAVRPAEPQPAFEEEIQNLFSGCNIKFVGNPCYFSIHGVEILSYHGQSLLDFSTNIQHLEYDKPVEIMETMMKKHHLAPTYGGFTPLAPEHSDYMVIDRVPDVFVTGHVHLATIGKYRGVTLINASSWQEQTDYQKMMNFVPDPGKLPIMDLKSGNVTMIDFNRGI
ncbi:MAG: DNA-directed DNA polymerase II small subunit [Candidatus Thermoplasmatota archaeon]